MIIWSGGRSAVRRFERGKISPEIADVVIAKLLCNRPHDVVLSCSGPEENQLPLNKEIGLSGYRRRVFDLGDAFFAVTSDASFCLAFSRTGISSNHTDTADNSRCS